MENKLLKPISKHGYTSSNLVIIDTTFTSKYILNILKRNLKVFVNVVLDFLN